MVLDFLAVDNFDFTRKIVKKIWGEKLVKMLGFCQNWIFGQKFDSSNSVHNTWGAHKNKGRKKGNQERREAWEGRRCFLLPITAIFLPYHPHNIFLFSPLYFRKNYGSFGVFQTKWFFKHSEKYLGWPKMDKKWHEN